MNKKKIIALVKLGMLAVMLILLFFIAEAFVDYVVTIPVETLTKAVYVIMATVVVGIYTTEEKEKAVKEKKTFNLFENRPKKKKTKEQQVIDTTVANLFN